ncbi:serine/threonine protein kinase, partial [Streptomyces gramineus]
GAAGAAAAARPKDDAAETAAATGQAASGSAPGAGSAGGARPATATPSVGTGAAAGTKPAAGRASSGWPVMPPPDLDLAPRPVPRAPLTDVVPRRTLVIIAVVVALAILGTVLALTLGGGGDDKGSGRSGGSKAVASSDTSKGSGAGSGSGSGGGSATKEDTSGGKETDDDSAAATGSGNSGGKEDSDDKGSSGSNSSGSDDSSSVARTYNGGQGYSIGLPAGWKFQTGSSAGDRFTGPDGQKLLIAWTSTPKDDPVADWKNQERYMVRSQYQKIRIASVDYRGWNTADWEFTYVDGGTEYRTVDRGFVVSSKQGYALMYTAKAADWNGELREDTWKTLAASFQPK